MLVKAPIPGNSLGRAKGPCHDCSESTLECDGQRPRCFTCMQNRVECRGYKMDLSWQSGVATRGNLKGFQYPTVQSPIKRTIKASGNTSLDEGASKGRKYLDGEFKFVAGRPAKRRKARQQTGQSHFNIGASPKAAPQSPVTAEYGPLSPRPAALVQAPYISSASSPGMSLGEIVVSVPISNVSRRMQ
jgi:hypothetical protein